MDTPTNALLEKELADARALLMTLMDLAMEAGVMHQSYDFKFRAQDAARRAREYFQVRACNHFDPLFYNPSECHTCGFSHQKHANP